MSLRLVHLHGRLRKQFGGPWVLNVRTPAEAVRALTVQIPGLRNAMTEHDYFVVRGDLLRGYRFDHAQMTMLIGDGHALHFYPVPSGAKHGGGALKVVVGLLVVVASIFTFGAAGVAAGAAAAAFGAAGAGITSAALTIGVGLGLSIALAGITQLISPQPKTVESQANSNTTFGGPANIGTQGGPVPVVYGRYLAQTVVVATSLRNDDLLNQLVTVAQPPKVGMLFSALVPRSDALYSTLTFDTGTLVVGRTPTADDAQTQAVNNANANDSSTGV